MVPPAPASMATCNALRDRGMAVDESLIVPGLFDFESGKAAAHGLFGLG